MNMIMKIVENSSENFKIVDGIENYTWFWLLNVTLKLKLGCYIIKSIIH